MERLPGYSTDYIWNMDESGLFFKVLPYTGLGKKNLKSVKALRNQKNNLLWHFCVIK